MRTFFIGFYTEFLSLGTAKSCTTFSGQPPLFVGSTDRPELTYLSAGAMLRCDPFKPQ